MKQKLYEKVLNAENIKTLSDEKIYDKFFCSLFFLNIFTFLTIIPINTNGISVENPISIAFDFLSIILFVIVIICSAFYLKYDLKYRFFKKRRISIIYLIPYYLIIIAGILNSVFTLEIIYDVETGYFQVTGYAGYFLFLIVPFWFFWLCFTCSSVLGCFAKYNPKNFYRSVFHDFNRKLK